MKWEHASVRLAGPYRNREAILNVYGRDGWELVAVTADGAEKVAYFKRPMTEETT